MGNTLGAITNSKAWIKIQVKFLVFIHSTCSYTNHSLKCFLWITFFSYLVCNFQGTDTLSRKKIVWKLPHSAASVTLCRLYSQLSSTAHWKANFSVCCNGKLGTMPCVAMQCKQAPYIAILSKLGKGRHVSSTHTCNAWVENIANAWLPYTNMWPSMGKPGIWDFLWKLSLMHLW